MQTGEHIGKYELEEFLGGGMSHVYRANDTVLGRPVAVKILTDIGCSQAETKARFLAEARMASNLSHDNVLSIYDFGEDSQNRPFMVMELLRGQDLRSAIQSGQIGDIEAKLRVALQVARAIRYIHSQKIIHRDIKPENVHVNSSGVVKLMDFGIAKTDGMSMTRAGFVLGTPYYMAPEQVKGTEVTEQVDVYAFGVMLFELMTGVKPIAGDTVERIFYVILNEPLNLAPLQAAGAPPAICELVARCTAKSPTDRPKGFAPICAALKELVSPTAEHAATMAAPVPAGMSRHSPRPALLWGSVAAFTAVVALGFALFWTGYGRLDAQIRSSAEAVSSAGIAADGLISPEAIRQFDILRGYVDTVHGYHRKSAPLGYRMGAWFRGGLYVRARALYFQRFRTFFLGPAQNNALQFLLGLPSTPGPSCGATYETLKAYLSVTSEPQRSDPKSLVSTLMGWWGAGLAPGPDREAAARQAFEFYARELTQDDPFSRDYDREAVAKARRYLSQFPNVERAYASLMDGAARRDAPLCFHCRFPGSEKSLTESYEVPGQFTKAGWDFVKDAMSHGESYFAGETWITGADPITGADWGDLSKALIKRYQADYVKAWLQYLQAGAMTPFSSVQDGGQKLRELAGESSPLIVWLTVAARNTAVDDASIRSAFQPLESAAASGSRYRASLASLSAALQKASGGEEAAIAAMERVQQSQKTAKEIEAVFQVDPQGHVEIQVARMLDQPINFARQVLR